LIHSIGDEEQAVRAQALQAISSLAEHGVITGEDSDTRNIRERLLPHMKHENWEIRRIAISAARFLFAKGSPSTRDEVVCDEEGVDECLAAGLRDSHEELRWATADALKHVATFGFSKCRASMLHLLSVVDCRHKTVEKDKIGLTVPADDDESNDNDCDGTSHGFTSFSAFEENCLERGEFRLEEEIEETQVRLAGIKSLTALFDVANCKKVCRYLLYHLLDYNKAIRHAAAATLVHFDPTLNYSSAFVAMLCDVDSSIRHEVGDVLKSASATKAPDVIVQLGHLCQRAGTSKLDMSIRTQALEILTSLSSKDVSAQVVSVLKSCTEHQNPEVRLSATQACQNLVRRTDSYLEQAMDLVMPLLDDMVWYVCLDAVRAMAQWVKENSLQKGRAPRLGTESQVVRELLKASNRIYQENGKFVYEAVREALMDICELQRKDILDQVMKGLVNDDFEIRNSAVTLIQTAFRPSTPVRPSFHDDYMSQSIQLIGDVLVEFQLLDAYVGRLTDGTATDDIADNEEISMEVRTKTLSSKLECILECLHYVVPHGSETAIDCVVACLQQQNYDVRSAAMRSLQKLLDNNPSQVVPMALPLLVHQDSHCRWVAKETLLLFCPRGDRKVMAEVLKIMNHKDTFVRHAASVAFVSILLPKDLEAVVRAVGDLQSKKELERLLKQMSSLQSSRSEAVLGSDMDSFFNELTLQDHRLHHLENTLSNEDWIRSSSNLDVRKHEKLLNRTRKEVENLWEELKSQGIEKSSIIQTRLKIKRLALTCLVAKIAPDGNRRSFFTSLCRELDGMSTLVEDINLSFAVPWKSASNISKAKAIFDNRLSTWRNRSSVKWSI